MLFLGHRRIGNFGKMVNYYVRCTALVMGWVKPRSRSKSSPPSVLTSGREQRGGRRLPQPEITGMRRGTQSPLQTTPINEWTAYSTCPIRRLVNRYQEDYTSTLS